MPTPTQPDSPRTIGILAEGGGFALYASWVAVLWEGLVVVPLSADTPNERLVGIVEDAAMVMVLVCDDGGMAAGTRLHATGSCSTVSIVDVRPLEAAGSASPARTRSGDQAKVKDEERGIGIGQNAYLYYTSGSTGEPKGVLSGHAPMMNRLRWMWRQWPLSENEVCCQRVDHIFIDFVAEVFGPLSCGVPVLVVPYSVRRNPVLLKDFIYNHRVTRITLVPTLARLIVEAANTTVPTRSALPSSQQTPRDDFGTATAFCFDSVRLWVLSGEALPWSDAGDLARLSLPTARLLNLYGSTEVAADVTFYSQSCAAILSEEGQSITGERSRKSGGALSYPIGRAITNCGLELMEVADFEHAGVTRGGAPATLHKIAATEEGRVGMLYIYGEALASGYWGRPAATNERFPSYTWDSASSSYHFSYGSSTRHQSPEMGPNLTLPNEEPGNGGKCDGKARGSRDQRPVRFFCTGDLASFEPSQAAGGDDGGEGRNLVYRGRLDQQIKINGQRLDLGEVEACVLRVRGVTLATAVAVCTEDAGRGQDGCEEQTPGLVRNSVVGVVLSPQGVEEAAVLAECRWHLPSFAVPQLVIVSTAIPTLPGSGKVDRRKARRLLLGEFRRRHCSGDASNRADNAAVPTLTSTHQGEVGTEENDVDAIVDLIMAAIESTFKSHGEKGIEVREYAPGRLADTNFFAETGLSSVQAVVLLHELRHNLASCGRDHRLCGRHTVSLIDLYSHPTARLLAQWLVSAPPPENTEGKIGQGRHPASTCQEASHGTVGTSARLTRGSSNGKECHDHNLLLHGVTIQPIRADLWAETSALFSSVFLSSEPLMAARFQRCRTTIGPAGTAVVRRCHKIILSRSLRFALQGGGRILTATSDTTGQVVGFTVGMELVESAQGSGFLASAGGERLAEDRACGRPRSPDNALRTKRRPWQSCTDWLLGIPLEPLIRPISDVIRELMTTYRHDRGWAYAPGEVMYISETGCRPDHSGSSTGTSKHRHGRGRDGLTVNELTREGDDDDDGSGGGGGGGGGIRAAVLAELLERDLLSEATSAGFIRAVTICTNSVTMHVARELGFKEVARISPVQTYHPPRCTTTYSRWRCFPWMKLQDAPRQGKSTRGNERRPGPFARVAQEHAHVVLYEKVLVPTVPLELLLDEHDGAAARSDGHGELCTVNCHPAITMTSPIDPSEYIDVRVATTGHEMWKIVPVGRMSWSHRCEMLAILANSLPFLASSGRAVKYMAEDIEQRQVAFVLLTASVTTGQNEVGQAAAAGNFDQAETQIDVSNDSLPVAPTWTVAACMSWRLGGRGHESVQNGGRAGLEGPMPSNEETGGGKDDYCSGPSPSTSCRELLVLAVGRRWRYRGVGASLVHRLLADSRRQGESFVYVRSMLDAVVFYERRGFRRVETEHAGGKGGVAEFTPPSDGECGLVYDLTPCSGHD